MSDPYRSQPGWTPPSTYGSVPGQGVPPAPPSGTGNPSAAPYPSAPPYQPAQPYQPVPSYQTAGYPVAYPSAPRPSAALGITSLILMVLATAGSGVLIAALTSVINEAARLSSSYQSSDYTTQLATSISMYFTGLVIAACVGFVCWILAIIATATNRGRVAGVIGIIMGIVAPLAIWGYFALALAETAQHYAR